MIYAGSLNEILTFYAVTEIQSASGYKTTVETLRFSCRAYRCKNKESYVVDAKEVFHSTELTFIIRYRKEISDTDIVVYNGDRYRITSLCPYKEENQITLILAKINE